MPRTFVPALLAPAMLALAAGHAAAELVIFSSDLDGQGRTPQFIRGLGSGVIGSGRCTLTLSDGPQGGFTQQFEADFFADLDITPASSVEAGGVTVHTYHVSGTYGFRNAGTVDVLLSAEVSDANWVVLGTPDRWGSTGTVQGSSPFNQIAFTWGGPNVPELGLAQGALFDDQEFTLGLDLVRTGVGLNPPNLGVALDDLHLPEQFWYSNVAFTGVANNVPAPASLTLLGVGGLLASRRRR
ncbi:MAG: hypothetical protein RBS39_00855 [Phycisphaerales bacterium]|jgi:MYXO-CTERM domain-containing protein|nr:hypothetical protein [Phycisphaerales bacterium]